MTRARDVANIDGLLTTTGDTYYASAAGTPTRLGVTVRPLGGRDVNGPLSF